LQKTHRDHYYSCHYFALYNALVKKGRHPIRGIGGLNGIAGIANRITNRITGDRFRTPYVDFIKDFFDLDAEVTFVKAGTNMEDLVEQVGGSVAIVKFTQSDFYGEKKMAYMRYPSSIFQAWGVA